MAANNLRSQFEPVFRMSWPMSFTKESQRKCTKISTILRLARLIWLVFMKCMTYFNHYQNYQMCIVRMEIILLRNSYIYQKTFHIIIVNIGNGSLLIYFHLNFLKSSVGGQNKNLNPTKAQIWWFWWNLDETVLAIVFKWDGFLTQVLLSAILHFW